MEKLLFKKSYSISAATILIGLLLPMCICTLPCDITCPGCSCSRPYEGNYDLSITCTQFNGTSLPECLMSNVTSLIIYGSRISRLSADDFKYVPNLKVFELRDTPSLISIDSDTFVSGNLKTARVSNCSLTDLPNTTFGHNDQLDTVDFSHNKLSHIPQNFLACCYWVHEINFSFNNISFISDSAFSGPPYVSSIDVSNNVITTISKNAFHDKTVLRSINLSNNKITHLEPGVLALGELTFLNLSGNQFLDVPSQALNIPIEPSLLVLDLSSNYISQLRNDSFNGLAFELLQELYLNNLPLVSISPGTFINNLGSLQHLSMTENNLLINFPSALLDPRNITNLRKLNLERNSLYRIKEEVFSSHQHLNDTDISGNPLICDCESLWVLRAIERNFTWTSYWNTTNIPTCGSPGPMTGFLIPNIKDYDLTCQPAVIENFTSRYIENGSPYFIAEAILGRGVPTSSWFLPNGRLIQPGVTSDGRVKAVEELLPDHRVSVTLKVIRPTWKDEGAYTLMVRNSAGVFNVSTFTLNLPTAHSAGLSATDWITIGVGAILVLTIATLLVIIYAQRKRTDPSEQGYNTITEDSQDEHN